MATSRNRDYSAPPEGIKNVAALYAWDQNTIVTGANNPQTGAWVSLQTDAAGALVVNVTGGSLSSTNPVGVTGTRVDSASGYATGTFLMAGGRAVEVSSGFNPGYASGAGAMFNLDRANGALLVEQTDLNAQFDSVTVLYQQGSTVSNSIISGSFAATTLQTGLALAINTGRRAWFIANTSNSNPLYVRLSNAAASTGAFNFILNPASSAGQQGASWFESPAQYVGPVSVSGTSFIAWEL